MNPFLVKLSLKVNQLDVPMLGIPAVSLQTDSRPSSASLTHLFVVMAAIKQTTCVSFHPGAFPSNKNPISGQRPPPPLSHGDDVIKLWCFLSCRDRKWVKVQGRVKRLFGLLFFNLPFCYLNAKHYETHEKFFLQQRTTIFPRNGAQDELLGKP